MRELCPARLNRVNLRQTATASAASCRAASRPTSSGKPSPRTAAMASPREGLRTYNRFNRVPRESIARPAGAGSGYPSRLGQSISKMPNQPKIRWASHALRIRPPARGGPIAIMRDDYLKSALLVIDDPMILVNVVSRRVKQLRHGSRALVESLEKLSAEDTALREIAEGKISYVLADPAARR